MSKNLLTRLNALASSTALRAAVALSLSPALAWAQPVGGATGTVGTVSGRVTAVAAGWQSIVMAIGGFIIAGAFAYVGYGMAFNAKKWSDVANVAFGAIIAGAGVMLSGWLFS